MKKCSMCQKEKPKSEFAKATGTKDLLQRGCRSCKAEQYQQHKGQYVEGSRQARVRRFAKLAELKNKPCMDCDVKYHPAIMEYDHVRGEKVANVSHLLLNEIAKCDLVCANCHRMRGYKRLEASGKACHYAEYV
jgi:hypothetical protein